jgi:hypothetical protein
MGSMTTIDRGRKIAVISDRCSVFSSAADQPVQDPVQRSRAAELAVLSGTQPVYRALSALDGVTDAARHALSDLAVASVTLTWWIINGISGYPYGRIAPVGSMRLHGASGW